MKACCLLGRKFTSKGPPKYDLRKYRQQTGSPPGHDPQIFHFGSLDKSKIESRSTSCLLFGTTHLSCSWAIFAKRSKCLYMIFISSPTTFPLSNWEPKENKSNHQTPTATSPRPTRHNHEGHPSTSCCARKCATSIISSGMGGLIFMCRSIGFDRGFVVPMTLRFHIRGQKPTGLLPSSHLPTFP